MARFDLQQNPFVRLGVTPRAQRAEINDAHSERLLDAETPEEERALELARQDIVTPRERLDAELAYLLEMRPAAARSVLADGSMGALRKAAASSHGLSKANLLVQAAQQSSDSRACIRLTDEVIGAYKDLDVAEVLTCLNEQRAVAGFPEVSRPEFEASLSDLGTAHAEALVSALSTHASIADEMIAVVEKAPELGNTPARRFLRKLLESYGRAVAHQMEAQERETIHALEVFVSEQGNAASFDDFEGRLRAWDKLAQPLQLADQLLGSDEVNSKKLFEDIRSHAIALANKHDRHDDALRISRLASEVFAELPTATAHLAEDINTLENIEHQKSVEKIVSPLRIAADRAADELALTSTIIARHGFRLEAPSPVGEVVQAYRDILALKPAPLVVELAVHEVRQLSIVLNNERQDYDAAERVIDLLLTNAEQIPEELIERLEQDRQTLAESAAFAHFQSAMREERFGDAKAHCDTLIGLAKDSSQRQQLVTLRDQIESRLSQKRVKTFVGWGIAAGIAALVIFNSDDNSDYSSSGYDNGYGDAVVLPADEALAEVPVTPEANVEDAPLSETPPPIGGGYRTLTLSEIRYCMKQSERIEGARNATNSYAQESNFNNLVDDWNSRCAQFRYNPSDMAMINGEVARELASLRQEGRSLIVTQNQTVASETPPFESDMPSPGPAEPSVAPSDEYYDIDEQGNLIERDGVPANFGSN